jgi:hypothetical protein
MKKSVVFGVLLVAALGLLQGAGAQVTQEWVARYTWTNGFNDDPYALVLDGNENVFITGASQTQYSATDFATVKYDSSGNQIWAVRYNGPGDGPDSAHALAVDRFGNVYVTGSSLGSGTGLDYVTIKYDSNGNQVWLTRYNGSGNSTDMANALAVDSSGNVYVTGASIGLGTSLDYATIKYNSSGNQLWVARYGGPANNFDAAYALKLDASDDVYVTGRSAGDGSSADYATLKYDANGNQLWVARYNGPANSSDIPHALELDGSGNVYVTGESHVSGFYNDYATVKYNTAGTQLWVAHYNGPGGFEDIAYALAVDGSGNVYVTGKSQGVDTTYDYATIKYNSAGSQQWVARYSGTGNGDDNATALALDGNGNVYVTGGSVGTGLGINLDYATVKYNAFGLQEWVARYDGSADGTDVARALALDNLRNVYLTGNSWGGFTAQDYVTIKYSQASSPTLDVTLTPLNPPIVIPANGGSFSFNVSLQRAVGPAAPYTVWARIKNPDGSYTAPTLGPVTINTPVGLLVTRTRNQNVPGAWSPGLYAYLGYANNLFVYPAVDSSSFTWTKSATADGNPWITAATCTGEPFPGEIFAASNQPSTFNILTASPNPFNPTTTLSFTLSSASHVSLKIYDTSGRLVSILVNGWREEGTHQAMFDGSSLAAAVYLVRLDTGNNVQVEKVVLLK